ncbi:MAG: hypothetical protein ACRC6C_02235 [Wolbachia pipientis]
MIKAIQENLFEKLGIDCNDIIENVGWPGYSCEDHGYRLNPFILSLGAAKSTERSLSCL